MIKLSIIYFKYIEKRFNLTLVLLLLIPFVGAIFGTNTPLYISMATSIFLLVLMFWVQKKTSTTYWIGHKSIWDRSIDDWRWIDNGKIVKTTDRKSCQKCNEILKFGEHDPCIKNLPGVINACCGHGINDGYVMLENRQRIALDEYYKKLNL